MFDSTGEYKHRHIVHGIDINNRDLENGILPTISMFYDANSHELYNTDENNNPETLITTKPRETRHNEPYYKICIPQFSCKHVKTIIKDI